MRHALDLMDAGAPVDALTTALLVGCGLDARDELIDFVYRRQDRRYWARPRTPRHRARRAGRPGRGRGSSPPRPTPSPRSPRRVLDRLDLPGPVVLAGGFAVHEPLVRQAVRDRLAGTEMRVLTHAPAVGAVRLAAALRRPRWRHCDLETL